MAHQVIVKGYVRRLTMISIVAAFVITIVGYWMYYEHFDLLLYPGILMELVGNVALLMIQTSDDYYSLPAGAHVFFNFAFYCSIIPFPALLIVVIRTSRKR